MHGIQIGVASHKIFKLQCTCRSVEMFIAFCGETDGPTTILMENNKRAPSQEFYARVIAKLDLDGRHKQQSLKWQRLQDMKAT